MEDRQIFKVYVKTDKCGTITAINSSAFLHDTTGWTEIDEGVGDKYCHAQNYYFSEPLTDSDGVYNFKMVNGRFEKRTDEDKAPERERLAAEQEIEDLKRKLAATDYIGIKIGEGAATKEEYADKLAEREFWRARINELEGKNG